MTAGTIHHGGHKERSPEHRRTKEMLSPQVAKTVWTSLQVLMKARGVTQEELAAALNCKRGTLKGIATGYLSRELMLRIKKWSSKT
jgi:ribosome-binding protein aMBF1 (putative translation factor)